MIKKFEKVSNKIIRQLGRVGESDPQGDAHKQLTLSGLRRPTVTEDRKSLQGTISRGINSAYSTLIWYQHKQYFITLVRHDLRRDKVLDVTDLA